jgi:hypothetical protein
MSGVYGYPTDPTQSAGTVGTSGGNTGTSITEGVTTVASGNNADRGIVGDIGAYREDISAANSTASASGTAYILATTSQITALADGIRLTWLPDVDNTGAATLNVDTLGAKKLLHDSAVLTAGEIKAGQPVDCVYDASADSAAGAWLVLNPVIVAATFAASDISNDSGVSGADVAAALDQLDTGIDAVLPQGATGPFTPPRMTETARDALVSPLAGYTIYNTTAAETQVYDGAAWKLSGGGTPSGTVIWFAANAAPTGYLKANGAAISRTTYADLFAAIGTTFGAGDGSTTFNIPDLRGEFIRGWDDGRSIDSGRGFGSAQTDEIKSHDHAIWTWAIGGGGSSGKFVGDSSNTSIGGGNDNAGVRATGGTETRPRNIALLACIKY